MGRTAKLARLGPSEPLERRALGVLSLTIAAVMLGVALFCGGIQSLMLFVANPGLAVVAAVFAAVPGAVYLTFILWLDRHEPEPPWLVAAALLWGGVVATGVSLLFNTLFGVVMIGLLGDVTTAQQVTASVSAPLVEETSKGFALIVLYVLFRRHFDSLLDGLVYGALVGLGFAVVENWLYYVQSGSIAGAIGLTWLRGLVTGAGTHMCFTAMTGAGVGLFRVLRSGPLRWGLPALGLATGVVAHFAWNTFAGVIAGLLSADGLVQMLCGLPVAVVVLQVPFLALAFAMVWAAAAHEQRLIAAYLDDEVAPVVREGEVVSLVRRRYRSLVVVLVTEGLGAWFVQRRRYARLVRLAFEKWHMEQEFDDGSPDARTHAIQVQALRAELSR